MKTLKSTAIITSAKNVVGTASVEFVAGVLSGLVVKITEPDRKIGTSTHAGRVTEALVLMSRDEIAAVIGLERLAPPSRDKKEAALARKARRLAKKAAAAALVVTPLGSVPAQAPGVVKNEAAHIEAVKEKVAAVEEFLATKTPKAKRAPKAKALPVHVPDAKDGVVIPAAYTEATKADDAQVIPVSDDGVKGLVLIDEVEGTTTVLAPKASTKPEPTVEERKARAAAARAKLASIKNGRSASAK